MIACWIYIQTDPVICNMGQHLVKSIFFQKFPSILKKKQANHIKFGGEGCSIFGIMTMLF